MNTPAMLNLHPDTAPWTWALQSHEATTLAADEASRWLRVDAGCLWVTARDRTDLGSAETGDIWLGAGDSLALPAGSEWVLEAWPQARLSLLVSAPGAVSRGRGLFSGRLLAFWQRLRSSSPPRAAAW